jgi:hypothetical protein
MVKQETGARLSKKELLWRERLARFTASGQQVAVFCSGEAVSEASFYRWRKQLKGPAATPVRAARFIDAGALAWLKFSHRPPPCRRGRPSRTSRSAWTLVTAWCCTS